MICKDAALTPFETVASGGAWTGREESRLEGCVSSRHKNWLQDFLVAEEGYPILCLMYTCHGIHSLPEATGGVTYGPPDVGGHFHRTFRAIMTSAVSLPRTFDSKFCFFIEKKKVRATLKMSKLVRPNSRTRGSASSVRRRRGAEQRGGGRGLEQSPEWARLSRFCQPARGIPCVRHRRHPAAAAAAAWYYPSVFRGRRTAILLLLHCRRRTTPTSRVCGYYLK